MKYLIQTYNLFWNVIIITAKLDRRARVFTKLYIVCSVVVCYYSRRESQNDIDSYNASIEIIEYYDSMMVFYDKDTKKIT